MAELGAKLDELNAKIKETGDRKDVERQAKRIYEQDVEKGLNDLASELRAVSIQSTWDAFHRCMSLTVPAQTVAVAATHLMPLGSGVLSSAVTLGAGALLTLTEDLLRAPQGTQGFKFTYLLDAKHAFNAPTTSSARLLAQEYQQLHKQ